jgi:hypothetical protein
LKLTTPSKLTSKRRCEMYRRKYTDDAADSGGAVAAAAAAAADTTATSGSGDEFEQSLSDVFANESENEYIFADQSMDGSFNVSDVLAVDRAKKKESSTNSSMQSSKSLSTLFNKMAWNGSCASFVGSQELLQFSSSLEDLDASQPGSSLRLKTIDEKKKFVPKYKTVQVKLRTRSSPMQYRNNRIRALNETGKYPLQYASCPIINPRNESASSRYFTRQSARASVVNATLPIVPSCMKGIESCTMEENPKYTSTFSEENTRKSKRSLGHSHCHLNDGRDHTVILLQHSPQRQLSSAAERGCCDVAPRPPIRGTSPERKKRRSTRTIISSLD